MSSEQNILAACILDRKAYETLTMHCSRTEFSPLTQHWLKHIGDYYERDEAANRADRTTLRSLGLGAVEARHSDTLATYFDELPLIGVSPENVVADILSHKRDQLGLRLAAQLAAPDVHYEDVREQLEQYERLAKDAERGLTRLHVLSPDDALDLYDPDKIIKLYPKALSKQCMGGGAAPGHHIVVFGRPEAGKSLFTINLACGIAFHNHSVLYFGNEESVKTHYARAACNLARKDIAQWEKNAAKIQEIAESRGLNNIRFIQLDPGTLADVEQGIIEFEPQVVVIDQLGGLDVGETNGTRAMDKAARGFRTLLLRHSCVGISVAQAGDKTEKHGQLPPAFLSMGDVYGSRTGLPAQADLMIGLGYDQDMYDRDVRGVSLPKNKLGGSHSGFKVRIDKQQSRVTALG